MTPLMWAAIEGHASVIKVLMKAGFHDILLFNFCVHMCVCGIVLMSYCCYHRTTSISPSVSYSEDTYLQVLIIYTLPVRFNPLPAKVKMNHLPLQ